MYSQDYWNVSDAQEMMSEWLEKAGYKDDNSVVWTLVNDVRNNHPYLGLTDMLGRPGRLFHRVTIYLPKIVSESQKRDLYPPEQFRDTVLHEYAHVLHNKNIQKAVDKKMKDESIAQAYYWNEWMNIRRQRGWSGHGTRWRTIARRVGAIDRASVASSIRRREALNGR